MVLDMSPTTSGLLEQIDADTYAAFGAGLDKLYGVAAGNVSAVPGQTSVTWTGAVALTRGAIELRENLTNGQAISNYTVEFCPPSLSIVQDMMQATGNHRTEGHMGSLAENVETLAASTGAESGCGGPYQPLLPLYNGPQLTIGNRRIHFWANVSVGGVRVTVSTLRLQSGPAEASLRSLSVFDWSDSSLDPLLKGILALD